MDFDQSLHELEQFSQFFRNDIEIPIEKYTIDFPNSKNLQQNKSSQEISIQPQSKVQTISSSIPLTDDTDIKKKKEEKPRKKVDEKCKCFFAIIKPADSPKGTRQTLLYSPPYIEIYERYTQDINNENLNFQMEVLPSNAEITYEGRHIYIKTNQTEREYTLKSKRDVFENIVSSEYKTPLIPFILSILGCESLPPTPQMALDFLYNTIYTDSFLISFNYLPQELLVSDNEDVDYIKCWVQASDPILDSIISQLFRIFLNTHHWQEEFNPLEEFPFQVAAKILEMDNEFSRFIDNMCNATDKVKTYLATLETMPFNQRSLMLFHLIYFEAQKKYPDSQAGARMVSLALFDSALYPAVREMKPSQNLSEMNNLITFAQTAVCLDQLKQYERILSVFKKQPKDFEPVRRGQSTFDAFLKLLDLVGKYPSEFLNVARRVDLEESA